MAEVSGLPDGWQYRKDWPKHARCRDGDPDAMFVVGKEQNVAKRTCMGCIVRFDCLADALDDHIEFGVWGGMTERERRALLRKHPGVGWKRAFGAVAALAAGAEETQTVENPEAA